MTRLQLRMQIFRTIILHFPFSFQMSSFLFLNSKSGSSRKGWGRKLLILHILPSPQRSCLAAPVHLTVLNMKKLSPKYLSQFLRKNNRSASSPSSKREKEKFPALFNYAKTFFYKKIKNCASLLYQSRRVFRNIISITRLRSK